MYASLIWQERPCFLTIKLHQQSFCPSVITGYVITVPYTLMRRVKPMFIVKPVIAKMVMYCTKEPVEDSTDATKDILTALWMMCCSKKQTSQTSKCWKMKTLLSCLVLNVCDLRSGIRIHWNASEFSPDIRVLSCASSTMNGWSLLDLQTQQSGVCSWFGAFCLPLRFSPCKLLKWSFLKCVLFSQFHEVVQCICSGVYCPCLSDVHANGCQEEMRT